MNEHQPPTIRINKRMAELGLCSRREADALIAAGLVAVNRAPATLGQMVTPTDTITIDTNAPAIHTPKRYFAYYKGRGIITHSPAPHETDIATRLANDYQLTGIYPVGRLDKDSEGLMLITNDGRLTGPLLDPANQIPKTYEVTVDKAVASSFLCKLERGVNIEGYTTKPATAKRLGATRFALTITEGKKHQIRRMCAALGYQVQALKRTQIAHITLGKLKPNQYRKLTTQELSELMSRLGIQR